MRRNAYPVMGGYREPEQEYIEGRVAGTPAYHCYEPWHIPNM